jgi:hypothetical protein
MWLLGGEILGKGVADIELSQGIAILPYLLFMHALQ